MSAEQIRQLLAKGENLRVEFKEARLDMPSSLFDTIAAFLNKEGGTILLGVEDTGTISGVDPQRAEQLRKDIVTASNNPDVLHPPFTLSVGQIELEGKLILYMQVPVSSQVHTHKSIIYDRENDSDLRITDSSRMGEIYFRKRQFFSESTIYPALGLQDLNPGLLVKARAIIRSLRSDHPWLETDDLGFMRRAGIYRRDLQTGTEGFTLAAALLFGYDETIGSILPAYKVKALVRRENLDRWDDRLTLRTNLIDSYGLLMDFIRKHLPDKFFLEGGQRKDLREIIFREVVGNVIVHREYTNALHTELVIYPDRVEATNPNRAIFRGPLLVDTFSAFAKNPSIRKVFTEFGWSDEIGSGIRNVNKYLPFYTGGARPQFLEHDTFKTLLPLQSSLFGDKAALLFKLAGLSLEQIQKLPTEELRQLPLLPELSRIEHADVFSYELVSCWAKKEDKLPYTRLLSIKDLEKWRQKDKTSSAQKQDKPLPKRMSNIIKILVGTVNPVSLENLLTYMEFNSRTTFLEMYLRPLLADELLKRTIEDKPNDPNQRYVLSEKGKLLLGGFDI
jgi:ATP-dependent DNA helicase RecG